MLKLVLDAMMKKLYCDKKKTKVNDNKYEESLSLDEKFECEELASVIMEQMKANAMKLNNNDKGICFSPQILWMALSLYIRSPVGYREFKESSLMIFPSERTMERMIAKMRMTDGVCPKTYQWLYDETISAMHDDREKAGHIMCDELQIKSTLCWNTKTHELVGFTSDSYTLDFLSELKALEEYNKEDGQAKNELGDDNIAKKVNQWRLRTVKGIHHNGEFWFNNGSLTGDELMWQFKHVVSCYEAVGIRILGFECDAGGQNARLLKYLRKDNELGNKGWLTRENILITNPANINNSIAVWFCATHQLKNMRNALLRSDGSGKQMLMKKGATISWQVILEAYKRDHQKGAPITDLTRVAAFPDSWSKMNVSAAKSPFTFKTITEMMTNLACQLCCTDQLVWDKPFVDNCDIYLHRLEILRNANNMPKGNPSTSTELATIEYCTHVAIIFIETLMNAKLSLSIDNIDKREELVQQSMKFFEDWKQETDSAHNGKSFLSMITYSDLRICVSGFFAYAHLVLESGIEYVPMLHSNTSTLEALYSTVRSMKKESARDYAKAVSTINAGSETAALHGNRCKSYSEKDIVPIPKRNINMMETALGRNDTGREKAFLEMKTGRKTTSSHNNSFWRPFEVDSMQWTISTRHNDMTGNLCHYIASNTVVGVDFFGEILCPVHANAISEQFDEYGIMSIGTKMESFMRNVYQLNLNEINMLDKASRYVFTILLLGFQDEMKKTKSKMARSFHAWVYMNFICKPEKVQHFISCLPPRLQCSFHEGPAFVLEIICNMFSTIVSKLRI